MATEVGSAYVSILPNLEKFGAKLSAGVKSAGSAAGDAGGKAAGISFSKGFLKFGAIAGAAGALASQAVNVIVNSLDAAIARVDTMNNFPLVMANMGISAEESAAAIEKVSEGINGLPTSLDSATMAVQRFASVNGDVGKSADMFLAVNDAILAGGANSQIQASALEQLSQAYSKGRMDMMEWRTLQMAMPAQLNQIAQAMGVTTDELGEGLRTGEISMDSFIDTITRLDKEGVNGFASFAEQSKAATGGIGTALTNVQNRISKALAMIIDAFGQTNISGAINSLSSSFTAIAEPIANFITAIRETVDLSVLAPTFDAIASGLDNMAQAANEIGTLIGGYVGQAIQKAIELGLAVSNMLQVKLQPIIEKLQPSLEKIGQAFQTFLAPIVDFIGGGEGDIFQTILSGISGLIDMMLPGLESIADAFGGFADSLQPLAETLGPVVVQILTMIQGLITTLAPIVAGVAQAIITALTTVYTIVITVFTVINDTITAFATKVQEVHDTVAPIFAAIGEAISSPIQTAKDTISGIIDEIVGFFSGLGDRITSAIGTIHFPTPHITFESVGVGNASITLPHIEWYARGGIVNAPTLFGAGEAGAEAIIPLSNQTYMRPFARAVAGEVGNVGNTYNVYIDGARLNDESEIKDATKSYLLNLMRLAAI